MVVVAFELACYRGALERKSSLFIIYVLDDNADVKDRAGGLRGYM